MKSADDELRRVKAEKGLEESEARYRALFEDSPIAIWEEDFSALKNRFDELKKSGVTDFRKYFTEHPEEVGVLAAAVKILEINNASVFAVGAADKAQVFRELPRYFTPESMDVFREELICLAEGKLSFRSEIRLVNTLGIPVIFDLSLSVQPAFAETLSRVLVSFVDISEQKRREEEIQQLNKDLEAFSYSVSHDLRAPLRGIDGWSMALLEDYAKVLDERGQDYLNRVRAEAQRMGQLIDDLLQLSMHTRVDMNMTEVDLSLVAESVLQRLSGRYSKPVTAEIQPGLKVWGDRPLIEVMMTNLLGNALKFTSKVTNPHIYFGSELVNDKPVFIVRDNGVGFETKYAAKLFGAFQRFHKVTEFPGTGIGLAIVQRIVHRHSGRIWAESKVGVGTTFFFTMGGAKVKVKSILLVEDNPSDIELTRRALGKSKISNHLTVVEDGLEALDFLFARGSHAGRDPRDTPAVILLDLNLPKIPGHEVLREIRGNESTRRLPVVVLTTSREEQDLVQSYDLGANSYIRKPVDFLQFASAIEQLELYWLVLNEAPTRP